MSVYGGEHSKDGDREFVPQAEGRLARASDTPRDLTFVLRSLTLEAVALSHDVLPLKPETTEGLNERERTAVDKLTRHIVGCLDLSAFLELLAKLNPSLPRVGFF